jgi:hypothetical protein
MAGITWEAVPATEYVSHIDLEQATNQNLFAVISGCTVTESGANMVVTVAAGVALVDGAVVTVAGNTITLVSDASNKRWSYATINGSGTAVLVSGTPAASAAVEPTKPDPASKTILKMYKIEAAQTIAANIAVAPEKRIMALTPSPIALVGSSSTPTSTTSTTAVDLVTISGLSILVTQEFRVEAEFRKQALAANAVAFGIKFNSTVFLEAADSSTSWTRSSAINQAEQGSALLGVPARATADYLQTYYVVSCGWRISSSGAQAAAGAIGSQTPAAAIPNVTITSAAIRAINGTASNAAEVGYIRILTGII